MDARLAKGPTRRDVETADGVVSALDFGDPGRPVDIVFAHANGFNAQTYRQALGPLAGALRIIAPDLRGHGLSRLRAAPRGHRSWRVFARDLLSLMDALELERTILAGHSMGATSALLAAGDAPERVRGLVLFEPVIVARPAMAILHLPGASAWLRRRLSLARQAMRRRDRFADRQEAFAAYRGRGGFRDWSETALADYLGGGLVEADEGVRLACEPAWESANYAAQAHDPYRALRALRAPVHILRADLGSTCRVSGMRALARRNPAFRVDTVERTNHFLPIVRPDVTREALLDMAAAVGA